MPLPSPPEQRRSHPRDSRKWKPTDQSTNQPTIHGRRRSDAISISKKWWRDPRPYLAGGAWDLGARWRGRRGGVEWICVLVARCLRFPRPSGSEVAVINTRARGFSGPGGVRWLLEDPATPTRHNGRWRCWWPPDQTPEASARGGWRLEREDGGDPGREAGANGGGRRERKATRSVPLRGIYGWG